MSVFNAYTRLKGTVDAVVNQNEKLYLHMPLDSSSSRYDAQSNSDASFSSVETCDLYIVVNDYKALITTIDILESEDINWHIIGKGTSIVPIDLHYNGALIELGHDFKNIEFNKSTGIVSAGAGCKLSNVVLSCAREGFRNLECLGGIPGCVGGAIRLNVAYDKGDARQKIKNSNSLSYSRLLGESAALTFIDQPSHIVELIEEIIIYNPLTHSLEKLNQDDFYNEDTQRGSSISLPVGSIILEVRFKGVYVGNDTEYSEDSLIESSVLDGMKDALVDSTDFSIRLALSRQPHARKLSVFPFNPTTLKGSYAHLLNECSKDGVGIDRSCVNDMVDKLYPEYIMWSGRSGSGIEDLIECMKAIRDDIKEVYGIELEPKITFLGVSS